jgi:hypothetical protein
MMLHSCEVGVVDREEEVWLPARQLDTIVIHAKSGGIALRFPFPRVQALTNSITGTRYFLLLSDSQLYSLSSILKISTRTLRPPTAMQTNNTDQSAPRLKGPVVPEATRLFYVEGINYKYT